MFVLTVDILTLKSKILLMAELLLLLSQSFQKNFLFVLAILKMFLKKKFYIEIRSWITNHGIIPKQISHHFGL